MPHVEAKLSSKGQITIPLAVREFFNLQPGDTVDFYLDEASREVRIKARNRDASELFGSLNAYSKPEGRYVSVEDMNDAVGRHLAEDDKRIQREWREWQEFKAWQEARSSVKRSAKSPAKHSPKPAGAAE